MHPRLSTDATFRLVCSRTSLIEDESVMARGYTPSKALADFVRCRDLSCRFPGCDKPASACDIDHTIAYGDGGPTQASKLKLLCRKHHRMAKDI